MNKVDRAELMICFVFRPDSNIAASGDKVTHCPDGYTEIRRDDQVIGVYRTDLLVTSSTSR